MDQLHLYYHRPVGRNYLLWSFRLFLKAEKNEASVVAALQSKAWNAAWMAFRYLYCLGDLYLRQEHGRRRMAGSRPLFCSWNSVYGLRKAYAEEKAGGVEADHSVSGQHEGGRGIKRFLLEILKS